jgi:squalene cyclase
MITLRRNWGSHPVVIRVLAYDPNTGQASVVFRDRDKTEFLETVPLEELEALDEDRQYVDVAEEVRLRAEVILKDRR